MRNKPLDYQPFSVKFWVKIRHFSPNLMTYLISLISVAPVYVAGYSNVRPCLTLIPVFYWALYRPQDFSILSAFIAGLFLDLLEGTPLGLNTLVFLMFYLLIQSQRRYLSKKPFLFIWFSFSTLSFLAYIFKWFMISVYYASFIPISITLISFLLLILSYPLLSLPCAKLYLYLLDKEK